MLPELDTYDWEQVFLAEEIDREDVVEILHRKEGSEEGWSEWSGVMVGRLKDTAYFSASGWCDTSGWGCQDGTSSYVNASLENVLSMGLTEDQRNDLGIVIVSPP